MKMKKYLVIGLPCLIVFSFCLFWYYSNDRSRSVASNENREENVVFMIHAENLQNGEVLVWKKEVPMAEILESKEFDEEKEFDEDEYLEVRNEEFAKIINGSHDYFQNHGVITPKGVVGFFENLGYILTIIQDDDEWYSSPENYASTISDLKFEGNMSTIWGWGKYVRKTLTREAISHTLPFLLPRFSIGQSPSDIIAEGRKYKKMANLLKQNEEQQNQINTLLDNALKKWREREGVNDETNVFAPMLSQ